MWQFALLQSHPQCWDHIKKYATIQMVDASPTCSPMKESVKDWWKRKTIANKKEKKWAMQLTCNVKWWMSLWKCFLEVKDEPQIGERAEWENKKSKRGQETERKTKSDKQCVWESARDSNTTYIRCDSWHVLCGYSFWKKRVRESEE